MLTRPLVCRIRSNLLLLVAITTISLSCSHFFAIRSVEGVRVSSPFLNTYGIDVLSLNYSHVTTDPDILPFLLQRTIIRQFDSILADYTPLQRVTVGNMVIMDPGIYAGLNSEYLCEMPPSELNLNPALLRDSGVSSRGIYRKRELKPSDPRWPDFNGTISLEGAVLVVARGNCSFQAKSYYAQRVGAAGLIVTNPFPPQMTPASLDYLVTMHRDPAFTEQLREEGVIRENEEFQFTTPSIFMTAASVAQIYYSFLTNLFNQAEMYQTLQLFLWNEAHPEAAAASSSTGASGPGSSNTTSPSTSEFIEGTGLTGISGVGGAQSTDVTTNGNVVLRRLLHVRQALEAQRRHLLQSQPPPTDLWPPPYVPEFEYTPPLVAIDVDSVFPGSKGSDSPSYDSFRVAAYFLLILPSLWFCVAVMYVGRKCSMRLRERRRREARNKLIQSVKYHVPTSNEMKETKFIAALAPTPCVHTSPPAPSKSSPRHTAVMATNPTSSNRLDASLLAHEEKEDAEANVEMQPVQSRPSHTGALTDVSLHPSSSTSFRDTFHHETATAGMSAAAARVFDEDDDDEDGANDPTDASIHLTSQPSPSANATPSQGCGMLGKNPVKIVGVACAICLSDFEEGETLSLLPCHHAFHPQCITPWLEKSDECALCRNSVSSHLLDDDTSSCCPSFCCPVSDSGLDRRMRQLEAERRAGNVEARAELIRERAIRAAAQASAPAVAEQSQQYQNENGQSVMMTPVSPNTASQHSIDGSIELFPTIQPPTITSSPTPVLPSSSSSSASPFGPFTDDRYHTARVRDASESFVRLVRRSGLMDESTPVEAAVLEIELASKEYALTYAPSAQPMALSDADALVLLTQLQSECNLITRHCIDSHPDLLEAALVYESTLQYVHEAIARRIKVNEPAMNN